ncbi:uncharacterized protein LOC133496610 [Syngnathoides biaculeatus]|uniref:uncharacterized protein LOC133496610 n=1 Tax=Syngnathoides biaculeatus TaxID=300417 RepID=UPI002ADDC6E6|nr:uncharacterized protein LOC133496610 [Syngnathoides biaculeatus]XP_061668390.1 uncharacterized protein LOC133496610 [Syngnathoides biaculeatus]
MTTGNYHEWRRVWNIGSKLWLQLHSERTKCNSTYCAGYWTQCNVSTVKTICKYQVLPVITTTGFWFLHLDGEWMDVGTNTTYEMKMCDETDRGMACTLQQGHSHPCLTDSEAVLCDRTREPRREMLWQIGPHALCVATMQNNSQVPSVPFVGCLYNVHLWHWGNQTYRLTNYSVSNRLTQVQWDVLKNPWNISLERFKCALEQSTEVQKIIQSHTSNISKLMVSTLVASGRVQHAAKIVQQSSAHHWWDIFSGISVTAWRTLVPPLILLVILIVLLSLCNLLTCIYVRRIRAEVEWVIMQRMR